MVIFDVCIRALVIFVGIGPGHWLSKATNNNLKIWFEFRGAEFGLAPLSVEDESLTYLGSSGLWES